MIFSSEVLQSEFWYGDIRICIIVFDPFSAFLVVWQNEVLIYEDCNFEEFLLTS
jgi:hypothetical protein